MKGSKKIGVNDLCPCGSGRKYKKCHKLTPEKPVPMNLPIEAIKEFRKKGKAQRIEDKKFQREFGKVRQSVSCEAWGDRLVAIGGAIYKTAKNANFHGFLVDFLCDLLNEEWLKGDLGNEGRLHPIKTFYSEIVRGDSFRISPTPSYYQFITLAYDLFILVNQMTLEEKIIERLKHCDQYPGARYELLIATTFMRAGFDIIFEDEADGSQKHVEFTAVHKRENIRFHVEGKRSESTRHNYGNLINSAIKKKGDLPLIVFLDMNKPSRPAKDYLGNSVKIKDLINKKIMRDESKNDPFDLLVLTNHPWEYFQTERSRVEIIQKIFKGNKPSRGSLKLVEALKTSFSQYANVPIEFPRET